MATAAKEQTTAVTTRRNQSEQLRAVIARIEPEMVKVLPKHLTPDRMLTLALVAASQNPDLYKCTPESLMLAVLRISQWGLDIGTSAFLVPFNTKVKTRDGKEDWQALCTPIPHYRGLIEMAVRSGHVRDILARAVYANEHFVVQQGSDERLEHHPIYGPTRGALVAVYAGAYLKHGRGTFEVMSRDEIDRIRGNAKSKDSPAWKNHFDEMAKKTVIRRLCKRLPQSSQMADALAAEDALAFARVSNLSAHVRSQLDADQPALSGEVDPPQPDAVESESQEAPTGGELPLDDRRPVRSAIQD